MHSKANKPQRVLLSAAAILFWLAVWELAAHLIDLPFAIPTVGATLTALYQLIQTLTFWQTIGASLGRMLLGLLLGTLLGALLAWLTVLSPIAEAFIRPVQTLIRCTPVASFIMLLWVLVGRDAVPMMIAVLMVTPVIWQGLCDGCRALDPALNDVVRVFHASPLQRLLLYVIPSLRGAFLTAFATATGLAWKSGIAAEIIAYSSRSIGRQIADARNLFHGADMMAWTVCVALLSLLCEKLITRVIRHWDAGGKGFF